MIQIELTRRGGGGMVRKSAVEVNQSFQMISENIFVQEK